MGVILFEAPDRLFTYKAGQQELSSNEVEEVIEQITHYRDTPGHVVNLKSCKQPIR